MKKLFISLLALTCLLGCAAPKNQNGESRKTEFEKVAGLVLDTIPNISSANDIKLKKVASSLCLVLDTCVTNPANYAKIGTWWRYVGHEPAVPARHPGVDIKPGDVDVCFALSGYREYESFNYDYRIDLKVFALMSADSAAELEKEKTYAFSGGSFTPAYKNSVSKIKCAEYKAAEVFLCDVFATDIKIKKY